MSIAIEISVGELLDKITILELKSERITEHEKLKNVSSELSVLSDRWVASDFSSVDLNQEKLALKKVNERLWEIEDAIREKEKQREFDDEFVQLARAVYFTNDERARIKQAINKKTGSGLVEEKSYSDYTAEQA